MLWSDDHAVHYMVRGEEAYWIKRGMDTQEAYLMTEALPPQVVVVVVVVNLRMELNQKSSGEYLSHRITSVEEDQFKLSLPQR